jgi:hypothetical protein
MNFRECKQVLLNFPDLNIWSFTEFSRFEYLFFFVSILEFWQLSQSLSKVYFVTGQVLYES